MAYPCRAVFELVLGVKHCVIICVSKFNVEDKDLTVIVSIYHCPIK